MLTNENVCAIIIHALGICVMVAQQTLTLYVWVRALDPQPIRTQLSRLGLTEFFVCFWKSVLINYKLGCIIKVEMFYGGILWETTI